MSGTNCGLEQTEGIELSELTPELTPIKSKVIHDGGTPCVPVAVQEGIPTGFRHDGGRRMDVGKERVEPNVSGRCERVDLEHSRRGRFREGWEDGKAGVKTDNKF